VGSITVGLSLFIWASAMIVWRVGHIEQKRAANHKTINAECLGNETEGLWSLEGGSAT
jgi:hypothetical protein